MFHSTGSSSSSSRKRLSTTRLLAALASLGLLLAASSSQAKDCGGTIACACGDRVVSSVVFTRDMNGCRQNGLTVVSGVLDCGNRQISGAGDRTNYVGVRIDRANGAEVRNCRVRNFGIGVYLDGGTANKVSKSTLFNNRIGVWVGDGATRNSIEDNVVRDNRDEGIHLGGTSSANVVARNKLTSNKTENLYLIDTTGNVVVDNVIDKSREAGIFLKNASDNTFIRNVLLKRPILLRGNSAGNLFEDNVLASGRFMFKPQENEDVWTFPHDNVVRGGSIAKGGTCFEFVGAYDNEASGVLVDNCRVIQEREAGGRIPTGNVVTVVKDR